MTTATMPPAIFRSTGEVVETNRRRRTTTAVWSTEEPDAYRTVFMQDGIDLSAFARNPVVMAAHRKDPERGEKPIGNAIDWAVRRHDGVKALIGTVKWWDQDEWVDRLFMRYASGEQRGWSICALPIEERPPTHAERRLPGWDAVDNVYVKTRLLEVSAVAIPGNHSTLTLSVERSALGLASHDPDLDHPDERVRFAAQCRLEHRARLDADRARADRFFAEARGRHESLRRSLRRQGLI